MVGNWFPIINESPANVLTVGCVVTEIDWRSVVTDVILGIIGIEATTFGCASGGIDVIIWGWGIRGTWVFGVGFISTVVGVGDHKVKSGIVVGGFTLDNKFPAGGLILIFIDVPAYIDGLALKLLADATISEINIVYKWMQWPYLNFHYDFSFRLFQMTIPRLNLLVTF